MPQHRFSDIVSMLNEQGFPTQFLPPNEEVPVDQLFVVLGQDQQGRILRLEMLFLPDLDEPPVLQLFVSLPYQVDQASIPDLARFILTLNANLPLTGFGLREFDDWIYFRQLIPCSDSHPLDSDTIVDTVWMIDYLIERFGPLIESIASGNRTLEESIQALAHNLERWEAEAFEDDNGHQ